MLVRRLADAAVVEAQGLRPRVLMDAGELGSRNLSVSWIEVPAGSSETLHSDEEAEQVYVVVAGRGSMSATGDTQSLEVGDLVLIPPASEHSIANDGGDALALVAVQSPGVSADELFSRRFATQAAAGYDEYDDDDE